jgi:hypothetical protein
MALRTSWLLPRLLPGVTFGCASGVIGHQDIARTITTGGHGGDSRLEYEEDQIRDQLHGCFADLVQLARDLR